MSEALLTDLYQLTMAQAYFAERMQGEAVFELAVRRLPPVRRFLVAAGLEQALAFLRGLRFAAADIAFLEGLGLFSAAFLEHLAQLRFTGSVRALAEGTVFFAAEPILQVSAPIIEAQLVESRLVNLVHLQTVIASKAARCVLAAGEPSAGGTNAARRLVDFGMRRAHGEEAALYAARAAYLAGFDATATVEAGRRFGIPLAGTMAHSYVQAHDDEATAFRRFLEYGPPATTLLIDTYDTERAARLVATLAREYAPRTAGRALGRIAAVRIDSGDLGALAAAVRRILDEAGFAGIRIVASGGLDERQLQALCAAGAPIEVFGIGTSLDVSEDAPALDIAYKLVCYEGRPRCKLSAGKRTLPGRKQVLRRYREDGALAGDRIGLDEESGEGEPLLQEVMRAGAPRGPAPSLSDSRSHCRSQLARLPAPLRTLEGGGGGAAAPSDYPVEVSARLQALAAQAQLRGR